MSMDDLADAILLQLSQIQSMSNHISISLLKCASPIPDETIDKILMYEDKRVEIVFKYRNEMAKAVDLIKGELDAGTVARNAVAGNEVAPETVGMIEDSAVSDNSTLSLREVS